MQAIVTRLSPPTSGARLAVNAAACLVAVMSVAFPWVAMTQAELCWWISDSNAATGVHHGPEDFGRSLFGAWMLAAAGAWRVLPVWSGNWSAAAVRALNHTGMTQLMFFLPLISRDAGRWLFVPLLALGVPLTMLLNQRLNRILFGIQPPAKPRPPGRGELEY